MNSNEISPEESFFKSIAVPVHYKNRAGEIEQSYLSPEEASFFSSLPPPVTQDESFFGVLKEGYQELSAAQNEIARGALKGVLELGEAFGGSGEKKINSQKRMESLREALPSEESEMTKKRERFGELLPSAIAGPGGIPQAILRTGLAVEGGNIGEAIGGQTGKAIGEILPYIAPNSTQLLQARNAAQQAQIDFGRKMGLTEEQLTVATKSDSWWNRQLSHLTTRRGGTESRINETKKALGKVYDDLEKLPEAQAVLSQNNGVDLLNRMTQTLNDVPVELRKKVIPDIIEHFNKPLTGESLMKLYKKINYHIGEIGGDVGKRLGGIQQDIRTSISQASPQLGMDFTLANKLYSNFSGMASKLKPNLVTDIVSASKALGTIVGLTTGNYVMAAQFAGPFAVRKLASELLLNPRLQNLDKKMLLALNDNKISAANQILEQIKREIKDSVPEYYDMIKNESFPVVHETHNKDKSKNTD